MVLLCSGTAKNGIHIAQNQPQEVWGYWSPEEEVETWASALFELVEKATPCKITLKEKA